MHSPHYRGASAADRMSKDRMSKDLMSDNLTPGFSSTFVSLWFRLITLGIIALVFAEALLLAPAKVQGWSFYLKPSELVFEVIVRLVFAALAGIALGTICAAAVAPFYWYFKSSRARLAEWSTKVAVFLIVFLDSRFALTTLIKWSHRGLRFETPLLVAHFLVFAIALCIPRARKQVVTSLDDFLSEKMTRRTAIATVAGTAALAATEFALGKTGRAVKAALGSQRPKSNFLLITFDALNAEDLSLYGNKLPTTPNIDAFASKGTVFTNFYSGFDVYDAERGDDDDWESIPQRAVFISCKAGCARRMRRRACRTRCELVVITPQPLPPIRLLIIWRKALRTDTMSCPSRRSRRVDCSICGSATSPLHQDSGFGTRIDEYFDFEDMWNLVGGMPRNLFRCVSGRT